MHIYFQFPSAEQEHKDVGQLRLPLVWRVKRLPTTSSPETSPPPPALEPSIAYLFPEQSRKMRMLAFVFLLFGGLNASPPPPALTEEEPPMACLDSGACYQVLAFVLRLTSSFPFGPKDTHEVNWTNQDKSTINHDLKGFLAEHKWWEPVCFIPGRPICPTTGGKSQVCLSIFFTRLRSNIRFVAPQPLVQVGGLLIMLIMMMLMAMMKKTALI